jgi:Phosphatidylinositol-4-phosphate 5-Kinase
MLFDRVLSVVATAQAVFVTLQAGSKFLGGLSSGSSSATLDDEDDIDLPFILPPNESDHQHYRLFDLTESFRASVRLGLRREIYASNSSFQVVTIDDLEALDKDLDYTLLESGTYQMSLVPAFIPRPRQQLGQENSALLLGSSIDESETASDAPALHEGIVATPGNRDSSNSTNGSATAALLLNITADRNNDTALLRLDTAHANNDKDDHLECWQSDLPSVTLRAYAPRTFSVLRSYFGLDNAQFGATLLDSGPFRSFQSNSKGAARSRGCFFFSRHGDYLIKTIKRDEMKTLLRMLPRYMDYMRRNGQVSLLNRFCGLYQVHRRGHSTGSNEPDDDFLVVMNSVFPVRGTHLQERFDLKGSTLGREASLEEVAALGSKVVWKDLDLMREFTDPAELGSGSADDGSAKATELDVHSHAQPPGLHIGPTLKAALLSQLERDVQFLCDCEVIDYSLLVGVAAVSSLPTRPQPIWSAVWRRFQKQKQTTIVPASPLSVVPGERKGQDVLYYFGLIDFLQPYDYKKRAEYRFKGLVHKSGTYSCVPPKAYAIRFLNFMERHIS